MKSLWLGLLGITLISCGSAAEYATESNAAVAPAADDNAKTVLGSYEFSFDPATNQSALTRISGLQTVSETLVMSQNAGQQLGQTLANSDVTLSAWSANDFIDNENSIRITNAAVQNTHSGGMHYLGLQARFLAINPTSVNMDSTPAHATCTTSPYQCTISYGDLPYNLTAKRPVYLFDPSAVSFRVGVNFEATLTNTSPTQYITDVDSTTWPQSPPYGGFVFTGLGFRGPGFFDPWPELRINGSTNGSADSTSPTQIISNSTTPCGTTSGFSEIIPYGGTSIPGPYIRANLARGLWNKRANAGDGQQTGTVHLWVWDGTGTPTNGCPPTSNLGNFYTENIPNVTIDTTNTSSILVDNMTVTGNSTLKIYIGFERPSTAAGLGNNDYYVYSTGQSVFTNRINNLPFVGGTFSYISQSGVCP